MINTIRVSILIFFVLILLFVMFYDYFEYFFYKLTKKSMVVENQVVQKVVSVPVMDSIRPIPVVTPIAEVPPVVESKPQVPVKPSIENEDAEEETTMENTVFFNETIKESSTFYKSLKGKNKTDFDNLFVLQGPKHVVSTLNYVVGGNNSHFFSDLFKYIFQYRRFITVDLLNILLNEMLSLTQDPLSMTLLYEAYIRVAYARRQSIEFFKEAKRVCELDVALHYDVLKTKGKFVYSFVRLAIILEKEKNITKALEVVNKAILRELDDNNATKFESRRARLQSKKYN
jgi:hypothetical protein